MTAVTLYAAGLLSIGLFRDWQLLHEDNGAMHTTLARSHLELGLARTRAHDLYYEPRRERGTIYGHHPPGLPLLLAAVFSITGCDAPAVSRVFVIACHLASVLLVASLAGRLLGPAWRPAGAFVAATLPMSAFFGRMVNYEPLCLLAVLLQLRGYVALRGSPETGTGSPMLRGPRSVGTIGVPVPVSGQPRRPSGWGLWILCAGIIMGGCIDWASLFFAAAIGAALLLDVWSNPGEDRFPLAAVISATVGIAVFDLWHLWYAGHGTLRPLRGVVSPGALWAGVSPAHFLFYQVQNFGYHYTHAGLLATVLIVLAISFPRPERRMGLVGDRAAGPIRRFLAINVAAALAYGLAAPAWSGHPYWQFYWIPAVVLAVLLVSRRLGCWFRQAPWLAGPILILLAADFLATSGWVLYRRHTQINPDALNWTQRFRDLYLAPVSDPKGP